ncbi:MAG TPA: hypothetical protein VLA49_06840 [Anaerolineales bacterium]|nr:hypothetical protein [Anaerolineales bacterium]
MALSGQKTVTTAGTAVALGSQQIAGPLLVKAKTTNTDLVYVGNDGAGDVSSSNGFPLAAGDVVILAHVGDLANVYVDSAVNGEGVAWLALNI